MTHDESLITADLQELIGVETPPRDAAITPEVTARVLETVGEDMSRLPADGDSAPPYILMAFGADLPLPDTPAAPISLVTGDEWTLPRPLRVGEGLTVTGALASVHERFSSRFGHTLVLRTVSTFRDRAGAVVAQAGRGFIRYRPPRPDALTGEPLRDLRDDDRGPPSGNSVERHAPQQAEGLPAEGEPLPPLALRPTLGQVIRYCGLTWNFVPLFYDLEEARAAGLPGTIVPGPLKLALLTRYVALWAGGRGEVQAVRAAHRRPDLTGMPVTLHGAVSQVERAGDAHTVDCQIWIENQAGERSVIGSASVRFPVPR